MSWYNFWKEQGRIDESIKAFETKGEKVLSQRKTADRGGEGLEEFFGQMAFGATQIAPHQYVYNKYIYQIFDSERERIIEYRKMAENPEIADVVEDAINESTQEDENGDVIRLVIKDEELGKNENIMTNLNAEFQNLFMSRLDMNTAIWDMMRTYYVDGRLYLEKLIDVKKPSAGIFGIKKLPADTMDKVYDVRTGQILGYYQYLKKKVIRPKTIEDAQRDPSVVVFEPEQIAYLDYGIYGLTRNIILGYLEKARIPYNQLKLLETSVIIYRIVRSPERLVFRIDTGNMPQSKAMKFVEKIKERMTKKQVYEPTTGRLTNETNIMSLLENYYLPQCLCLSTPIELLDGRTITLEKIIDEHKKGKKNEVYSVDQNNGKVITGEIEWAGVTRKDTEIVRVWLDNGKYIDCTPDHKFLVWKDENKKEMIEVEAQNLTEEMDLVE